MNLTDHQYVRLWEHMRSLTESALEKKRQLRIVFWEYSNSYSSDEESKIKTKKP